MSSRIIIIAVLALLVGTVAGFLMCRALRRYIPRYAPKKKKMGVMDKILVLEAILLISYTVAAMWIFYRVGSEPSTLTACVFGVCGLENGVMGWIKTNKDKADKAAEEVKAKIEAALQAGREPPEGDLL